jgi:hypothetical protein
MTKENVAPGWIDVALQLAASTTPISIIYICTYCSASQCENPLLIFFLPNFQNCSIADTIVLHCSCAGSTTSNDLFYLYRLFILHASILSTNKSDASILVAPLLLALLY